MLNDSNDYEELKKFDIKLDKKYLAGSKWETIFAEIIGNDIKMEVKSELKYSWGKSGNIFIELYQFRNNKWEPSGLSATTSEYWVHVLKTENQEEMHATIMLPTETLKKRLRLFFDKGMCRIVTKPKTSDGNQTKGIIIDPRILLYTNDELEQYQDKLKEKQYIKLWKKQLK